MSATTPDVPLHPHTDRWVFRSGGESGRVSRAERRGVYGDDEARRACADAGEKPDRPWHRTTSSSRILTLRSRRVKAFLSLGEFAHDATAGIFNDYVALQVWAGTPGGIQRESGPGTSPVTRLISYNPRGQRKRRRRDGGLQATKPLQLSCNRAAGSGVQLSVRRVEDNCCIALIF